MGQVNWTAGCGTACPVVWEVGGESCLLLDLKMSDEEIWLVKNDIYDLAFEFEINTGIEFSPIIKNEDQYEYWVDTLPFYRNVRDEGGEWSVNDEIEKYLADKSIQY